MNSAPFSFLAAAAFLLVGCGQAQQSAPAEAPAPAASSAPAHHALTISQPWARPTPGGVDMAAGYLTIFNAGADDALVGASSPRAAMVEIHQTTTENGVTRMRPAESLPIAMSQTLTLAPGGAHIMFMQLDAPFAEGEQVPVTLRFSSGAVVETVLAVRHDGADAEEAHDRH